MILDVMIDGIRYVPDIEKPKIAQSFTAFISQHRRLRKMKQNEVAHAIAIQPTRFHRIEAGYEPTLTELVKISDFYGFTLEEVAARYR